MQTIQTNLNVVSAFQLELKMKRITGPMLQNKLMYNMTNNKYMGN